MSNLMTAITLLATVTGIIASVVYLDTTVKTQTATFQTSVSGATFS